MYIYIYIYKKIESGRGLMAFQAETKNRIQTTVSCPNYISHSAIA